MLGVSRLSDASAAAKTMTHGRMMRRGGKRSSSMPMPGEKSATVMAAIAKAFDIGSRCHPNAA